MMPSSIVASSLAIVHSCKNLFPRVRWCRKYAKCLTQRRNKFFQSLYRDGQKTKMECFPVGIFLEHVPKMGFERARLPRASPERSRGMPQLFLKHAPCFE